MRPFSGEEVVDSEETAVVKQQKEEGKKQQKVSFFKLFAFADFYDHVLMALGSVGACVHGASVPVFFIFFGKLIHIIGLAYLFPKEASHEVAKVCLIILIIIISTINIYIIYPS